MDGLSGIRCAVAPQPLPPLRRIFGRRRPWSTEQRQFASHLKSSRYDFGAFRDRIDPARISLRAATHFSIKTYVDSFDSASRRRVASSSIAFRNWELLRPTDSSLQ